MSHHDVSVLLNLFTLFHIIAILQLAKAGMVNMTISIDFLKIVKYFGASVPSSRDLKNLQVNKETM